MRKISKWLVTAALLCSFVPTQAFSIGFPFFNPPYLPDSRAFWNNSKNWTTNFGPAYRDTVEQTSNFVPCTGQYALCFKSGPEPLPCHMDKDGRFAHCKCTVETGLNFVTISSILNYKVYQETIAVCGTDGSGCSKTIDKAPVCKYLRNGRLLPGADVLSDFSPQHQNDLSNAMAQRSSASGITHCDKAPYAGCMTASCQFRHGYAECDCPVFYGKFQLTQADAQCDLGGDLIWSASYVPALDSSATTSVSK